MIKVLFVCLGNICRSPLAEGVFAHLVDQAGLAGQIGCDSAGIGGWHAGDLPDRRSRAVAQRHGLALTHRARQLQASDFGEFDYIFAMDRDNLRDLHERARWAGGPPKAQVALLREFDPVPGTLEMDDPYYGPDADFAECYQIALRCGQAILAHLRATHSLRP
jgi:protein-tyrosine phosphatase